MSYTGSIYVCSNGRLKFPVAVKYGVTFMVGP